MNLDILLESLLKMISPVGFIFYHLWCKPAESEEFCCISFHASVSLLQVHKLILHFSLSRLGEES